MAMMVGDLFLMFKHLPVEFVGQGIDGGVHIVAFAIGGAEMPRRMAAADVDAAIERLENI